jgi:hypothetical protein
MLWVLSGLIRICAWCEKIWDENGFWKPADTNMREHPEAEFTHGICPDCAKEVYPLLYGEEAQNSK